MKDVSITVDVPDEIYSKLEKMAAAREVSIETLLCDSFIEIVEQYEVFQQLKARAIKDGDVEQALKLLRR